MDWFSGSIPDAVAQAKMNNKLLLVYIEGSDEMSKQMTNTYNDPNVAEKMSSGNIVALKLIANSIPCRQFSEIYPVLVIPSSFFIAGNGVAIEIITGSVATVEFSSKVDKVLETYQQTSSAKEKAISSPSTSKQTEVPSEPVTNKEIASPGPSTSQDAVEAESGAFLDNKVERAKLLVEALRQKKELEEREKEKRDEVERRNMGKAIQEAEKNKKDLEMKEWAKSRAKEKEEERLAREKVKAMIAQDRAERAAKYQQTKEAEQAEKERNDRAREEMERANRNAAMNSNEARIQFRLPDGSYTNQCFSADASLEDARRFVVEVVRPPFSNFSLCTTFPRRHFTESNYSENLRDLQLAPSAVLLILPTSTVANVSQGSSGLLYNLFWMVIAPFRGVWNYLLSWLPGASQQTSGPAEAQSPPTNQAPATNVNQPSDNARAASQRKESQFAKREGNIFRINNQSDDDENNTWNGNSTQQM